MTGTPWPPFNNASDYVDLEEEEFEAILNAVETCLTQDFHWNGECESNDASGAKPADERDYHLRYGFLPLYQRLREAREKQRLTPNGRIFRVIFS